MINNTLLFVTKLAVGTLLVFWLLLAFTSSANADGYLKNWHKLGSVVFNITQYNKNQFVASIQEQRNQAIRNWLRNPGAGVQRHHKGHVHTPFCGHNFDK